MDVRIRSVRLGDRHVYLLQGDDTILVDASNAGYGAQFRQWLEHEGISPGDVRLILLTHAHGDHAGSAREIHELTGAPVAVHELERSWLARGEAPIPYGIAGSIVHTPGYTPGLGMRSSGQWRDLCRRRSLRWGARARKLPEHDYRCLFDPQVHLRRGPSG